MTTPGGLTAAYRSQQRREAEEMRTAKHIKGCRRSCGGTFVCDVCSRRVGYCNGAADTMPGACTDCWYSTHGGTPPISAADPKGSAE